MEQQARQCNAELGNLPDKRGENLVALLENIADLVKISISQRDIVVIHRVPQANSGSSQPKNVVVKFSSSILSDSFLAAVRLRKEITTEQLGISGPTHKIYINEHLTLTNKGLFRLARETAKQHSFWFVWIKHGSILARQHEK
ncbi:Zinc finger DNA binding protein [Operophtera brumata]|uniref:Zinc finger DNA binding protein n=1 Tax=Operophtera brumata TaxID=104452 RepID=A0A0L7KMX2_OPEBR|nr:Zinc finger DNA binding protein [Operophtera brumata]